MPHDDNTRRFEELTLPHLDAAYNLARWLSGNSSEAEDVVQESYLRAFRYFSSLRGGNARAWLLAIVRRTWYDAWQKCKDAETGAVFDETVNDCEPLAGWNDPADNEPEAQAIRSEGIERVRRALAGLPVPFREVLVLRELQDLTYGEIAAIAGIPVGTVMSRLSRGRRLLAMALRAAGPPPPNEPGSN